ncbi:hypothetical protein KL905_002768 [Ogataea polymorpha]|nr:uncharacterized protein OGAPODRAFT_15316 [Ogataea polymorpha]KAG7893189.1 hypothetical protein KL908_002922 [Ogataea polymorpha]KAG7900626.1 hypothetical protein KL935_002559 [Ogataea polymorpha]KAG7907819.1 hypothetical protein KL906_003236 [Ogataea polymorpha]KAG7916403.1 hypothetical protein KL927_003042 [Ogataea polymorpha]KAG7921310.1 hypothetical protein KL905_002768 [Ogataea polymorpha]
MPSSEDISTEINEPSITTTLDTTLINENPPESTMKSQKRRNRPSFVCINCKKKKIKCDKKLPCSNCLKSHLADSCHYRHSPAKYPRLKDDLGRESPFEKQNPLQRGTLTQQLPLFLNYSSSRSSNVSSDLEALRESRSLRTGRREGPSLQTDVEELKSKVVFLEEALRNKNEQLHRDDSSLNTENDGSNSVFSMKSSKLKLNCIYAKKSRFLAFGFASFRTSIAHQKEMTFFLHQFIDRLTQERKHWKNSRRIPSKSTIFGLKGDEKRFAQEIEAKILRHYTAMLHLIDYFDQHLNNFLMNQLIDIIQVKSHFHTMFVRDEHGKVHFVKPEKSYEYPNLAIIFAIVKISVIFINYKELSEHRDKPLFDLRESSTIFDECCQAALNLSRFDQKQNINVLLALLLRRLSLLYSAVDGDGGDGANLLPVIHTAVSTALQMGLHRSLDSINAISGKEASAMGFSHSPNIWCKIWAQLKYLDALGSLTVGAPFLVNDDFADNRDAQDEHQNYFMPERDKITRDLTELYREASLVFNSNRPVSLNDMVLTIMKIIEFHESIGSFSDLIMVPTEDSDIVAWKVNTKFNLLELVQGLCTNLRLVVSNQKLLKQELKGRDLQYNEIRLLELLDQRLLTISLKCALLSYILMNKILRGESEISKPKYVVYFKPQLTALLLRSSLTFGTSIFSTSTSSTQNIDASDLIRFDSIDYNALELSLTDTIHCDSSLNDIIAKFQHPKQLVKCLCEFYQSVSDIDELGTDYGFFCCFKLTLMICFVIESTNKLYIEQEKSDKTQENPRINITSIAKKTKELIDSNLTLGATERNLPFFQSQESLDTYINNLFSSDVNLNWSSVDTGQELYGLPWNGINDDTQKTTNNTGDPIGNIYGQSVDDAEFSNRSYQVFF